MKKVPLIYKVARAILRPIAYLLFPYKADQTEKLPTEGKCLLCSNHLSFVDPVLLVMTQKRQIHFMSKQELFKNKLFAKILLKLGAFPVNRGSGDGKAINMAEDLLKDESVVGIFFEGTRSKTGDLLRPRAGVAMIAYQTGAPVVPCCITPKKKKMKVFSKVRITYGDPLTVEQLGLVNGTPSEFRNATRLIMEKVTELREQHLKEYEK